MGSVGKFLKKSLKFTADAYTLGSASAFGGGGGGGDQASEVRAIYGQAGRNQAQLHAQQTAAVQRGINRIPESYKKARTAATEGRNVSVQTALDRGAQTQASAQQSLVQRGLYNSTVLDNARSGISSGVTRTLADINAAHAHMLGQLDIGEGQAQMQGQMALAGAFGQQAGQNANLLQGQAQTIASIQYEDPDAWLNSLLGIAGTAIGYGIGGPVGGAVGGSLGGAAGGGYTGNPNLYSN